MYTLSKSLKGQHAVAQATARLLGAPTRSAHRRGNRDEADQWVSGGNHPRVAAHGQGYRSLAQNTSQSETQSGQIPNRDSQMPLEINSWGADTGTNRIRERTATASADANERTRSIFNAQPSFTTPPSQRQPRVHPRPRQLELERGLRPHYGEDAPASGPVLARTTSENRTPPWPHGSVARGPGRPADMASGASTMSSESHGRSLHAGHPHGTLGAGRRAGAQNTPSQGSMRGYATVRERVPQTLSMDVLAASALARLQALNSNAARGQTQVFTSSLFADALTTQASVEAALLPQARPHSTLSWSKLWPSCNSNTRTPSGQSNPATGPVTATMPNSTATGATPASAPAHDPLAGPREVPCAGTEPHQQQHQQEHQSRHAQQAQHTTSSQRARSAPPQRGASSESQSGASTASMDTQRYTVYDTTTANDVPPRPHHPQTDYHAAYTASLHDGGISQRPTHDEPATSERARKEAFNIYKLRYGRNIGVDRWNPPDEDANDASAAGSAARGTSSASMNAQGGLAQQGASTVSSHGAAAQSASYTSRMTIEVRRHAMSASTETGAADRRSGPTGGARRGLATLSHGWMDATRGVSAELEAGEGEGQGGRADPVDRMWGVSGSRAMRRFPAEVFDTASAAATATITDSATDAILSADTATVLAIAAADADARTMARGMSHVPPRGTAMRSALTAAAMAALPGAKGRDPVPFVPARNPWGTTDTRAYADVVCAADGHVFNHAGAHAATVGLSMPAGVCVDGTMLRGRKSWAEAVRSVRDAAARRRGSSAPPAPLSVQRRGFATQRDRTKTLRANVDAERNARHGIRRNEGGARDVSADTDGFSRAPAATSTADRAYDMRRDDDSADSRFDNVGGAGVRMDAAGSENSRVRRESVLGDNVGADSVRRDAEGSVNTRVAYAPEGGVSSGGLGSGVKGSSAESGRVLMGAEGADAMEEGPRRYAEGVFTRALNISKQTADATGRGGNASRSMGRPLPGHSRAGTIAGHSHTAFSTKSSSESSNNNVSSSSTGSSGSSGVSHTNAPASGAQAAGISREQARRAVREVLAGVPIDKSRRTQAVGEGLVARLKRQDTGAGGSPGAGQSGGSARAFSTFSRLFAAVRALRNEVVNSRLLSSLATGETGPQEVVTDPRKREGRYAFHARKTRHKTPTRAITPGSHDPSREPQRVLAKVYRGGAEAPVRRGEREITSAFVPASLLQETTAYELCGVHTQPRVRVERNDRGASRWMHLPQNERSPVSRVTAPATTSSPDVLAVAAVTPPDQHLVSATPTPVPEVPRRPMPTLRRIETPTRSGGRDTPHGGPVAVHDTVVVDPEEAFLRSARAQLRNYRRAVTTAAGSMVQQPQPRAYGTIASPFAGPTALASSISSGSGSTWRVLPVTVRPFSMLVRAQARAAASSLAARCRHGRDLRACGECALTGLGMRYSTMHSTRSHSVTQPATRPIIVRSQERGMSTHSNRLFDLPTGANMRPVTLATEYPYPSPVDPRRMDMAVDVREVLPRPTRSGRRAVSGAMALHYGGSSMVRGTGARASQATEPVRDSFFQQSLPMRSTTAGVTIPSNAARLTEVMSLIGLAEPAAEGWLDRAVRDLRAGRGVRASRPRPPVPATSRVARGRQAKGIMSGQASAPRSLRSRRAARIEARVAARERAVRRLQGYAPVVGAAVPVARAMIPAGVPAPRGMLRGGSVRAALTPVIAAARRSLHTGTGANASVTLSSPRRYMSSSRDMSSSRGVDSMGGLSGGCGIAGRVVSGHVSGRSTGVQPPAEPADAGSLRGGEAQGARTDVGVGASEGLGTSVAGGDDAREQRTTSGSKNIHHTPHARSSTTGPSGSSKGPTSAQVRHASTHKDTPLGTTGVAASRVTHNLALDQEKMAEEGGHCGGKGSLVGCSLVGDSWTSGKETPTHAAQGHHQGISTISVAGKHSLSDANLASRVIEPAGQPPNVAPATTPTGAPLAPAAARMPTIDAVPTREGMMANARAAIESNFGYSPSSSSSTLSSSAHSASRSRSQTSPSSPSSPAASAYRTSSSASPLQQSQQASPSHSQAQSSSLRSTTSTDGRKGSTPAVHANNREAGATATHASAQQSMPSSAGATTGAATTATSASGRGKKQKKRDMLGRASCNFSEFDPEGDWEDRFDGFVRRKIPKPHKNFKTDVDKHEFGVEKD